MATEQLGSEFFSGMLAHSVILAGAPGDAWRIHGKWREGKRSASSTVYEKGYSIIVIKNRWIGI